MTEVTAEIPKDTTTTTPIEKADVLNTESKLEEVTPAQPEGEATVESKTEEKKKEVATIENGYLQIASKKLMMKLWNKSYFAFGSEPVTLPNLRTYYKKSIRGIKQPAISKPVTTPSEVADTSATKVDEPNISTSSDAVEETKESEDKKTENKETEPIKELEIKKAETEPKEAETKDETNESEHNVSPSIHQIYKNIAHASQTGEGLLFYYKSDSETHKIPHGIINLKEVKNVIPLNEKSAFKIETTYRTFELSADKVEDRDRWIKTIKEKVENAKVISIETTDDFKEIYDKLNKGTAFISESKSGELSDDVLSAGEDEHQDKIRSIDNNKRKSFLPFFSKKSSTTEATTTTITENTNEDASKVTTTTETPKINTSVEKEKETEESRSGEPKSPKPNKFINYFFKKSEKEETTTTDDAKDAKPEETANAETSTAAVSSSAVSNGVETPEVDQKKKLFESIFKKTSGKENPKEGTSENKETEQTEQIEQTKTETHAEETTQQKESFLNKIFKQKQKDETHKEGENIETKIESIEIPAENTTSGVKSDEKTEEHAEAHKKGEGATSEEESNEASDVEPSLVRRVTKIFSGRRAKSPKADVKHESIARELNEETEEKKEDGETSETNPTEKTDAPAQTAEQQTVPESSTETTEDKNKTKFFNFGRRKSGGNSKKENPESQEKGETETAAVASASEATDVENTMKVDKEKEPENAVQKSIFPEFIKRGELQKQSHFNVFRMETRHFMLTNEFKLLYFKSNTDAANPKSIDLDSSKIKIGEGAKFDIETKSKRIYKLIANSVEDRDEWIEKLKESIKVTVVPEKESTSIKKPEEEPKLDVPTKNENENENDIQQSVENAGRKAEAEVSGAQVSEAQETTTKSTKVEATEGTEETSITTETITTTVSS